MMGRWWVRAAWAMLLAGFLTEVAWCAPTAAQREEISELSVALTKAGNLFKQGKHAESADLVKEVQGKVEKLAASDKALAPFLEALFGKLERAHALLELEGFELPPLKKPSEVEPEGKPMPGKPGAPNGALSFSTHVVPILVGKCGGCHVNNARGQFSMSSFANLMKGPPAGKVVFPGDPIGSRLIEVIESGDMPRGGLKVTPDELATLKKWITDGAKFDGKSDQDSLTSLNPNAKPDAAPMVQVMEATGKETISFARDIAPVLAANCTNCHGTMRPRENFSLINFTSLLKGGDSGPPIVPGKPAESLIIKKLLGTGGGQRMPVGRDPLPTDVMAKIEKWIEEGAKFDGGDPGQDVAQVAALARAKGSTHEQLSADRAKLAGENWRLGMPSTPPNRFESANFLVLGNVGEATLADIGARAEAMAPKVAAVFKAPADQPLIKGRMTLFVFGDRYDYSEFGQMVERRQIPKEWRGHWQFNIVDSYGAIVPARNDEYSLELLVAQQLAGAYIASLGKTPRWFAEGAARATAAKLDGGDARVAGWNEQLSAVLAAMSSPDDGVNGKLAPEMNEVANYAYVTFLMNDRRFPKLLDQLKTGAAFDKAFSETFGGSPGQVAEAWVKRGAKPKPAGKAKAKG
ncbi:MAG: c-type cytochrome domain-containing protein [Pirellulales bacterium]